MIPVILNSQADSLSFENFQSSFLDICEEHKKTDRALAFAFILYDFKQPHIIKVLEDKHYWAALHEISGHLLTVFSIQHKEKYRAKRSNAYDFDGGVIYNLVSLPFDFNPSIASDNLINRYFDKTLQVTYPSILFFQVSNNKIIDYIIVKLKESEVEKSYNEIKVHIEAAVEALRRIEKPYKSNSKEIFDQLELNIRSVTVEQNIIRISEVVKSIFSFLRIIKSFIG